MKLRTLATSGFGSLLCVAASACGPAYVGVPGSTAPSRPDVPGTVFTILLENEDLGSVLNSSVPYLYSLAQNYGSAAAYTTSTHPSLPNYLLLTSGSTNGVIDDGPPSQHPIAGDTNLADQLDAGGVPWRAYMEGMGSPCVTNDVGQYMVHHDPFVYYDTLNTDATRCSNHVVDFDQNFASDLATNQYRYMWITPNSCNDMHSCPVATGDAWLSRVIPQIMASPGYRSGGAIFILFDEGNEGLQYVAGVLFGAQQNIPAVVISPNLPYPGFVSRVGHDHQSYLATVEDIFGLPRLQTTQDATPMSEFFTGPTDGGVEAGVGAALDGAAVANPTP
jgi:phosphatidylinositol-3-phosphatase